MKTTLELPDALYRQAQEQASRQHLSFDELLLKSLQRELGTSISATSEAELTTLYRQADSRPRQAGSVGPLDRSTLHTRGVS